MNYYRFKLLRRYNDRQSQGYQVYSWEFDTEPQQYINRLGQEERKAGSSLSGSQWYISILHEITEEDYDNKTIFSIPIKECVF